MAEKDLVAEGESVSYEGIFKLKETIESLKHTLNERGYFPVEKAHTESLTPDGKNIEIKFESENIVSDYAKKKLDVKVKCEKVKEKTVEKAQQKGRYVVGKVTFEIDAALITDYEVRWKENKPAFYVIRTLFEKFIHSPYGKKIKAEIREDVDHVKKSMESFLNLYKY